MHGTFIDLAGHEVDFDLDLLKVIARGRSGIRNGWSGMLVYCPMHKKLIELRSSPPSIRGESLDEASEVEENYARENYEADLEKIADLMR